MWKRYLVSAKPGCLLFFGFFPQKAHPYLSRAWLQRHSVPFCVLFMSRESSLWRRTFWFWYLWVLSFPFSSIICRLGNFNRARKPRALHCEVTIVSRCQRFKVMLNFRCSLTFIMSWTQHLWSLYGCFGVSYQVRNLCWWFCCKHSLLAFQVRSFLCSLSFSICL